MISERSLVTRSSGPDERYLSAELETSPFGETLPRAVEQEGDLGQLGGSTQQRTATLCLALLQVAPARFRDPDSRRQRLV